MKTMMWVASVFTIVAVILAGGQIAKSAEQFPEDTLTIVCPYSPGGGTDALSRILASTAEKYIDESVIVENKTGGGGAVGMAAVATAKPDGYTISMATIEVALLPQAGLASFQTSDLRPIIRVNFDPASIVVGADSPFTTIGELVEYGKENPGELNVMTSSFPTNFWLTTTLVEEYSGAVFNKVVAQAGAADQIQNLLGGHVDAITVTPAEVSSALENGDVRILAIASEERLEAFSDIPTMKEAGLDIVIGPWRALMVPTATPDDVVRRLEEIFTKAFNDQDVIDFMAQYGFGRAYMSADDMETDIKKQVEIFKPVIAKYKN